MWSGGCVFLVRYSATADIAAVGGASGIVLHEAVEVYLAARPTFRQLHRHLLVLPVGWHRQHPLVQLRAPGPEIHLVVARRAEMQRVLLERHRNHTFITHHSTLITHHSTFITHHSTLITHHSTFITHHSTFITNKPHRRHRPEAYDQFLIVHRQPSAVQREAVAVDAHKMVALRAVHPHGLCVQPYAQGRGHARR